PRRAWLTRPVAASQMRSLPSLPITARDRPSGLQAIREKLSAGIGRMGISSQVVASHTLTVVPLPPATIRFPSGLYATPVAQPGYLRVSIILLVVVSQIFTVSSLAEARWTPSGLNARLPIWVPPSFRRRISRPVTTSAIRIFLSPAEVVEATRVPSGLK